MSSPIIGITTRSAQSDVYKIAMVATPRSYTEAVLRAGAIPVLIPLHVPKAQRETLLSRIDGIIFTGGGDINQNHFAGEDHDAIYDTDDERDEMELNFIHEVKRAEKPVLGICRGLQVFNVAHGGTLFTHISDQLPDAIKHDYFPGHPWTLRAHQVQVDEDSLLAEVVGEPVLEVNSLHHQGIKELGHGLRAIAKAPDGLVEAIEIEDHPFGLAVQWHPEWLPGDAASEAIIGSLVKAAAHGR
jgi:putative glutamine amidotransferase